MVALKPAQVVASMLLTVTVANLNAVPVNNCVAEIFTVASQVPIATSPPPNPTLPTPPSFPGAPAAPGAPGAPGSPLTP